MAFAIVLTPADEAAVLTEFVSETLSATHFKP